MTAQFIDLRSDTVTLPTPAMREAMAAAEVGDDVYGEDPTVNKLEELAAEKVGKEAALFVTSGTMGNIVALATHCSKGDEVIVEKDAHIYACEAGNMAVIGGIIPRVIRGRNGIVTAADVAGALREENIHYPPTTLICLENTHNWGGGTVLPVENCREIYQLAREKGLKVHLDGARIFNAAVAAGVPVTEFTRYADSVMFCLSKGLAAPAGSILAGSKEFIKRARKVRKMLGGGMRQAGVLAAAGILALTQMVERLREDHANARFLAEGLAQIPGINIDLSTVQTNIVIFRISEMGIGREKFLSELLRYGIKASGRGADTIRMVTHYGISRQDVIKTLDAIRAIAANHPH